MRNKQRKQHRLINKCKNKYISADVDKKFEQYELNKKSWPFIKHSNASCLFLRPQLTMMSPVTRQDVLTTFSGHTNQPAVTIDHLQEQASMGQYITYRPKEAYLLIGLLDSVGPTGLQGRVSKHSL